MAPNSTATHRRFCRYASEMVKVSENVAHSETIHSGANEGEGHGAR
jgi:hypothetical protein